MSRPVTSGGAQAGTFGERQAAIGDPAGIDAHEPGHTADSMRVGPPQAGPPSHAESSRVPDASTPIAEDNHEDMGMFSFVPPGSAGSALSPPVTSESTAQRKVTRNAYTPQFAHVWQPPDTQQSLSSAALASLQQTSPAVSSDARPTSDGHFQYAPPSTGYSISASSPPTSSQGRVGLSPAAAIAAAYTKRRSRPEALFESPESRVKASAPSSADSDGPQRRRSPYAYPQSPQYPIDNPYDHSSDIIAASSPPDTGNYSDYSHAYPPGTGVHARTNGQAVRQYSDNTFGGVDSADSKNDSKTRHGSQGDLFKSDSLNTQNQIPTVDGAYPEGMEEEDSPYPEVRASVSNYDDPEMPCITFRSITLGLFFVVVCGSLNLFFQLRYPSPYITPIFVQICSYPFGKLFAAVLPSRSFELPKWLVRLCARCGYVTTRCSLNPGPFNVKEHSVIIIMANAATAPVYALSLSLVLDKYYNTPKGIGFAFLISLSTQLCGFAFAGLCRKFLVIPASMIWPPNLVVCTLLNTFHAEDDDGSDGRMTRYRFFSLIFGGAIIYYFFPGFIFQALSAFSWVCWIAPNNVIVNQLFGVGSGLGMGLFTFDWSQIAYIGSPLIVPFWASMNIIAGFLFFFWFLTPLLYYTNKLNFAYFPISTASLFDRFGEPYNVSAVLMPGTVQLDVAAYEAYSPLYMTASFTMLYTVAFAISTATLVHALLYHGPAILARLKGIRSEEEDVHAKLMRNYPEVPDWWYAIYLLIFFVVSIITIEVYDTGMPVWALVIAFALPALYIVPIGFILAVTAQQISTNLISEIIPGYLLAGRPVANMVFKVFSVQSLLAGSSFVQDLKLGHYMKVPPRATFMVQIIATVAACLVQTGVQQWMIDNVPDLCSSAQDQRFICPRVGVFFSSSVVWGLIGPARQFSVGSFYNGISYAALAGVFAPVIPWLLMRKYPNSWLRYVSVPVFLTGTSQIPPATGINYSSWFIFAFIFQYWIRRRRFRWWSKYNFVLSAALEGGTILGTLFVFFCLQYPRNGTIAINWWGNDVFTKTLDWQGVTYRNAPESGIPNS
ncbi:uncharacterized protein L969DRAFT_85375 [Mixia osmundae IAM 14324]|nr:uncharacterized protein L969DRAFT_85375 [Mixia osmundae IAM 14324]KEI41575.1 hypothetical protein L969DRAFT_85375 [Mixia osmundae IAM 14324]